MASTTQGFQHIAFGAEPLARVARSMATAIGVAFKRLAAAQERAAQRRLMRQLSLSDRRVMDQFRAIRDRHS